MSSLLLFEDIDKHDLNYDKKSGQVLLLFEDIVKQLKFVKSMEKKDLEGKIQFFNINYVRTPCDLNPLTMAILAHAWNLS